MIELPEPPQHLIEQSVRITHPPPTSTSGGWREGRPRVLTLNVTTAAAPWLRDAVARVSHLTALRPNWDSYGARPIDATSATRVVGFLLDHAYGGLSAPSVVPMTDGGVQIEWHRQGIDLEISFSDSEPGVYLEDLRSGEVREEPLDAAGALILRYLGRLSR